MTEEEPRPRFCWLPVLLVAVGAFLPGSGFWGANHLAYLPVLWRAAWFVLAGLLLLGAAVRPRLALLPAHPAALFVLAALAALAFGLFSSATLFPGDGLLLTDLVRQEVPFRAFDSLDYIAHALTFRLLDGGLPAAQVYRWGAVAAGLLCLAGLGPLLRRLAWPTDRVLLFLGLFLFSGPVLMFHGYAESYGFLLAVLTCFLVAGMSVALGRTPLWVASTLLAAALALQLTAVFSLPALVFLAWRAPGLTRGRRWLEGAGPPAVGLLLAAGIHLLLGFDSAWFDREYLQGSHTAGLLTPLAGPFGLFSVYQMKASFNQILVTSPVSLAVIATLGPWLWRARGNRQVQFLMVQLGALAVAGLLVQRKLGDARDWDLLAAHFAALPLLAALATGQVWPASNLAARRFALSALAAALLVQAPWVALHARTDSAVERFSDVAAGFPPFARGYAYEGLGQYFRDGGQTDRALDMYRLGAESCPGNPRFHKLLGSAYLDLAAPEARGSDRRAQLLDLAAASYLRSLADNPDQDTVRENLGRILIQTGRFAEAEDQYRLLLESNPTLASAWASLGYCQLQNGDNTAAAASLTRALELDPGLKVQRYLQQALGTSPDK